MKEKKYKSRKYAHIGKRMKSWKRRWTSKFRRRDQKKNELQH